MKSDGKSLENLVSFVEKKLLPQGFKVTTNEKIIDEDGINIAEFDIVIRGKLGSSEISWLIECRDRRSDGPQSGYWIEQLVGRQSRFNFNKVTAVSTTGFSAGAKKFAQERNIDLREVKSLSPEDFSDWLKITEIKQRKISVKSMSYKIIAHPPVMHHVMKNIEERLKISDGNSLLFRSSVSGEKISIMMLLHQTQEKINEIGMRTDPGEPGITIDMDLLFDDEDHLIIDVEETLVRVFSVFCSVNLVVEETVHLLDETAEYKNTLSGEGISQMVSLAPQILFDGLSVSTEIHRIKDTGEMFVRLRKATDK